MKPIILSLCDRTGIWSDPYRRAGYDVIQVDLSAGQDVRLLHHIRGCVVGIIAQPPCTHLAGSGARWWATKGEAALLEALSIADACLRQVAIHADTLDFWVLENPVGRLRRYIGPPRMTFNPCDYAGWLEGGAMADEAYTKRTLLWGRFNQPVKRPVAPALGSKMHRLPPSPDRADLRSVTPRGFAEAFFAANPGPLGMPLVEMKPSPSPAAKGVHPLPSPTPTDAPKVAAPQGGEG